MYLNLWSEVHYVIISFSELSKLSHFNLSVFTHLNLQKIIKCILVKQPKIFGQSSWTLDTACLIIIRDSLMDCCGCRSAPTPKWHIVLYIGIFTCLKLKHYKMFVQQDGLKKEDHLRKLLSRGMSEHLCWRVAWECSISVSALFWE